MPLILVQSNQFFVFFRYLATLLRDAPFTVILMSFANGINFFHLIAASASTTIAFNVNIELFTELYYL